MKILIDDGMQIQNGTGIGNYSLYLYHSLKKRRGIDVSLHQYKKSGLKQTMERIKYILYINSPAFLKKCQKVDVVHFTNYAIPFWKIGKIKYVVTVHDLASFSYPETVSKLYGVYNRFFIKHAIRYADVVLTVSDSVKEELMEKWPDYEKKIVRVYPGLYDMIEGKTNKKSDTFEKDELKSLICGKFFLCVGTVEVRKNLGIVINAFLSMKQRGIGSDYKLVLAGKLGFGSEKYIKQIQDSDYGKDILVTGYISSHDRNKLYRESGAYIFPSIYEGFGSTQLECMLNHTPLILSDIPTNKEISKEYGLFFDLKDQKTLEQQMEKIINNEYDYLEKNRIADIICEEYKWDKLTDKYLEAYRG